MNLITLTEQDKLRYNEFVASQQSGTFLQSWDWGNWQEQLGKQAYRFFVMHDDAIIISAQIIKTAIPHFGYYLYIPYGPLSAQTAEAGVRSQAFQTLITELQKQFVDALFIRVESTEEFAVSDFTHQITKHIQPGKTLVLDLTKTEEQLLAEMHPKTRYNIKVAEKHGVNVMRKASLNHKHLDLLQETTKRQAYKSQPPHYFEKLVAFLDGHAFVYEAIYEETLLAVGIMIDFAHTRIYLFGGSSQELKNVMAPHAMHWEAIKNAKGAGQTRYDFWGIETASGATPGFVRFKLGFGGTEVQYPPTVDIINHGFKYKLYKLLRRFA
jgi:lipid II:glycine glycyltransferase (peptidoglycan interpeptide bridge formation enzyme)